MNRLKQIYVGVAQGLPTVLPGGLTPYGGTRAGAGRGTWLASLGAIYHLDRMIALDIPWWNVAATRVVDDFLRSHRGARVFEYGSGASTVWLARRAGSVTSVEHDTGWANKVAKHIAPYSQAHLVTAGYDADDGSADQPYVAAIDGSGSYDLIVVDGRMRAHCLARALPHLKPDGMILFDDSGRRRYRAAITGSGLVERHFHGLSYCVPYPDHTSLLTCPPSAR